LKKRHCHANSCELLPIGWRHCIGYATALQAAAKILRYAAFNRVSSPLLFITRLLPHATLHTGYARRCHGCAIEVACRHDTPPPFAGYWFGHELNIIEG